MLLWRFAQGLLLYRKLLLRGEEVGLMDILTAIWKVLVQMAVAFHFERS